MSLRYRPSRREALRRAEWVLDRSGILTWLTHSAIGKQVKGERLSPKAFLLGAFVTAILKEEMYLVNITHNLNQIAKEDRIRIGAKGKAKKPGQGDCHQITYRSVERMFSLIVATLDEGFESGGERFDMQRFCDDLLEGSVPPDIELTNSYAIDGTDVETWARRQSWGSDDRDRETQETDGDGEADTAKSVRSKKPSGFVNPSDWPKLGADGRRRHSKDPDATEGYRSGDNGKPGETYLGFEAHALVAVESDPNRSSGKRVPIITRRIQVESSGSHKGDAARQLVGRAHSRGLVIEELLADRGYTHSDPIRFAHPIRKGGTEIVLDLRQDQRGLFPTGLDGVIGLNCSLFVDCLPESLRNISIWPMMASREVREPIMGKFDLQARYAFRPHTSPDAGGYQRFRGPAVGNDATVRCKNVPSSMRLSPRNRPLTTCEPGEDCACGKTITVPPNLAAKVRQRYVWGSTKWAKSYARRSRVESAFSGIKVNFGRVARDSKRVFGLAKNTFLLAAVFVAANLAQADAYRRDEGMPSLFAEAGEPEVPTKRSATKRRTESYDVLLGTDAPEEGPAPPDL